MTRKNPAGHFEMPSENKTRVKRKIIVLEFLTLDGVIQAPGGPAEDTSGGFKHGGWAFPYFDEFMGKVMGELWLKIFPIMLGSGKRLFREDTMPSAFTLTDSKTSPAGVIVANYRRAGEVKTGSFE